MTPQERYENDPFFHRLVDTLHQALREAQFTATEVREAAMLAAIHFDAHTIRKTFYANQGGAL